MTNGGINDLNNTASQLKLATLLLKKNRNLLTEKLAPMTKANVERQCLHGTATAQTA